MSCLAAFLLLILCTVPVWSLCSTGYSDGRPSPYPVWCPDQSHHYSPRMGYQTGSPVQTYPWTQSQYPSWSPGYGHGYSYGHNDIRRTGTYSPTTYPYGSYPSYSRSVPYSAPYGIQYPTTRYTPYNQHVSFPSTQYASPYSSMYSNSKWWPSAGQNYHYMSHQPYPRYENNFIDQFPDSYNYQKSYYPFPFGRSSNAREGKAVIRGRTGGSVDGVIEFCQIGTNMRVKGRVTGIPGGQGNRGLHILKDSTCPPLDQLPVDSKILDHFNPFNSPMHGPRDSMHKHAGDLGNIFVQFDGVSVFDFQVGQLSFSDPLTSIANRTIIITEREDDLGSNAQNIESRLRGNSGKAIACGVIQTQDTFAPATYVPPYLLPPVTPEDEFMRRRDFIPDYSSPTQYPYPRYY